MTSHFDTAISEKFAVHTDNDDKLGNIYSKDGKLVSRAFGRTPEYSTLVDAEVYTRCFEGPVVRLWKDPDSGEIYFSSLRFLNAESQFYAPGETFGELFNERAGEYTDNVFIAPGDTHLFMLASQSNTVSIKHSFGRNEVVFLGVMNTQGCYTPSFDLTESADLYFGCYVPPCLNRSEAEEVFGGFWNQSDAIMAYHLEDGGYRPVKCVSPGCKMRGNVCCGAPDVLRGVFNFLSQDHTGFELPKFLPDGCHYLEGSLSGEKICDTFYLALYYRECVSLDKMHLVLPACGEFLDTRKWLVDFIHTGGYQDVVTLNGRNDLVEHISKRCGDIAQRSSTKGQIAGFVRREFGSSLYKFYQVRCELARC